MEWIRYEVHSCSSIYTWIMSRSSYGNGLTGRYFWWTFFTCCRWKDSVAICELGIGTPICDDGGKADLADMIVIIFDGRDNVMRQKFLGGRVPKQHGRRALAEIDVRGQGHLRQLSA